MDIEMADPGEFLYTPVALFLYLPQGRFVLPSEEWGAGKRSVRPMERRDQCACCPHNWRGGLHFLVSKGIRGYRDECRPYSNLTSCIFHTHDGLLP